MLRPVPAQKRSLCEGTLYDLGISESGNPIRNSE